MAPKYPSIPEPTANVQSLRDSVLTIKQAFEVLTGQRGNEDYRAVLLPELTTIGIAAYETAWTPYTPTITAGVGAFTTVNVAGRYKRIGKTVFVYIIINIATNGTAASHIRVSLPVPSLNVSQVLVGRENSVVGFMVEAPTTGNDIVIFKYDNTYPGGNGYSITVSGIYESV